MSIKSILKNLSISADVDHVDLGSAKGTPSDIYVGTKDIVEQLVVQSIAGKAIALENMIGKKAVKGRLPVALTELGALQAGGDMDFFHFLIDDVLSEPAVLVGLTVLIGLIAQKEPATERIKGTIKTIMGSATLGAGADSVVSSLGDFANIFQRVFGIQDIVPNNETITSIVQESFGEEMAMIVFFAIVINTVIARFTPWKFIFLIGHHTLFMSMIVAIILATVGMANVTFTAVGFLVVGVAAVFFPAVAHLYMKKVTGSDDVTTGHFSTLSYVLAGFIGSKFGSKEYSTEDMDVPKSLPFLRDAPVAISFTMSIIFLVTYLFTGVDAVKELSGSKN